jgi:hypothetical protein
LFDLSEGISIKIAGDFSQIPKPLILQARPLVEDVQNLAKTWPAFSRICRSRFRTCEKIAKRFNRC